MDFPEFRQSMKDKPTYVILGVQGSGTNFTARILNRVFGVSVVRDRALILGTAASLIGQPTAADFKRARDKIYQCHFPNPVRKRLLPRQWYHQAASYAGIEEWLHKTDMKTAAEFADFFYDYHAFVEGCPEKGIKSDDCWEHLDQIAKVIPNRRNVLLVRDPRDNANSIMGKDFGPRTVYGASNYVKHQLAIYLKETDENPEISLTTKYETLLATPMDFVQEFSEFSGLAIPDDAEDRLEALGIRRQNYAKWKKWSEYEIAVSETILRDQLKKLDYELHTSEPLKLTSADAARFHALEIAKRIPQRLKSIWDHKVLAK